MLQTECNESINKTIHSGDSQDEKYFPASNILTRQMTEEWGKSYWLSPYKRSGQFFLDLGCEETINTVELVNTHNAHGKDWSTEGFHIFVRYNILSFLMFNCKEAALHSTSNKS